MSATTKAKAKARKMQAAQVAQAVAQVASASVDRKDIVRAVRAVAPAVAKAGALPLLCGVRLRVEGGRLWVDANDLDLSISAPVEGTATGAGTVVASGLADLVGKALPPGQVVVSIAEKLTLSCNGTTVRPYAQPPDDWPASKQVEGTSVRLEPGDIEAMKRVASAASNDPCRPILTAVQVANGYAAATDSYRLAVARLDADPPTALWPARVVQLLPSEPVDVTIADERVAWSDSTRTVRGRLAQGEFPAWEKVMPKATDHRVTVDRLALLASVRRAAAVVGKSGVPLCLSPDAAGLVVRVRSEGEERFADFVRCDLGVGCPEVFLNPKFVADGLAMLKGATVEIGVTDALRPVLFTDPEDDSLRYLLMPVRAG